MTDWLDYERDPEYMSRADAIAAYQFDHGGDVRGEEVVPEPEP